jgi:periplasmic divalent cation tolerance protein
MTTDLYLLFISCPDEATGQGIAEALVGAHLAACVNLIPGLTSTYRWEGQIERTAEVLLLVKTTAVQYPQVEEAIRARHPYELPEIIAVPVQKGFLPYLDWVRQACTAAAA